MATSRLPAHSKARSQSINASNITELPANLNKSRNRTSILWLYEVIILFYCKLILLQPHAYNIMATSQLLTLTEARSQSIGASNYTFILHNTTTRIIWNLTTGTHVLYMYIAIAKTYS